MFHKLPQSNRALQQAYDATLDGGSGAFELRDQNTPGRSQRVSELAVQLTRKVSLREDEIVKLRRGALLHEFGNKGIPDSILNMPSP